MDKQTFFEKLKEFFSANEDPSPVSEEQNSSNSNTITETNQDAEPSFDETTFNSQLELLLKDTDNHQELITSILNSFSNLNNSERVSHRFDGKTTSDSSKGISSLGTNLEETSLFADEVDKLCKSGLDRRSAYIQAKQNLMEK